MRNRVLLVLAALLVAAPIALPAQGQESLAEAARKAREKRKAAAQVKKIFSNDDFAASTSSVAGTETAPAAGAASSAAAGTTSVPGAADAAEPEKPAETPEQKWRKRFADAREKLATAEKELAVLRRELSENQVQYYPDPQKTLYQEVLRSDINDKRKRIDEKQKEVAALKQGMEDLERQLRAEGGAAGWAREQ